MSLNNPVLMMLGGRPGTGKTTLAPLFGRALQTINGKPSVVLDKDCLQPLRDNGVAAMEDMIAIAQQRVDVSDSFVADLKIAMQNAIAHDRAMMPFLILLQGLIAARDGLNAVLVFPAEHEDQEWRAQADRFVLGMAPCDVRFVFAWLSCEPQRRKALLTSRLNNDRSTVNNLSFDFDGEDLINHSGPGGQDIILDSTDAPHGPRFLGCMDMLRSTVLNKAPISTLDQTADDVAFAVDTIGTKALRAATWLNLKN